MPLLVRASKKLPLSKEKRPILQSDILYDFIYITFMSYHNYTPREEISSSQGLEWGKLMGVALRGNTGESGADG